MDGLLRLVRRNDDAVPLVLVNGRVAWRDGEIAPRVGTDGGFGRWLGRGGTEITVPAARRALAG
jgi:hypothetical protein